MISSTLNNENFYAGQTVALLLVIPFEEVYGEIDKQNNENLLNIIVTSIVSLVTFIITTGLCMIYVKKKIVEMVSAITELNKCALNLSKQDEGNTVTNSEWRLVANVISYSSRSMRWGR